MYNRVKGKKDDIADTIIMVEVICGRFGWRLTPEKPKLISFSVSQ